MHHSAQKVARIELFDVEATELEKRRPGIEMAVKLALVNALRHLPKHFLGGSKMIIVNG